MLFSKSNIVADALLFLTAFSTTTQAGGCGTKVTPPENDQELDTDYLDTYYITSQEDADQLAANCTDYSGRLVISTNSTKNLTLGTLKNIYGQLDIIGSTSLSSISAPSLFEVLGNFTLGNLPNLSNVDFPKLSIASGVLLYDLPKIDVIAFPAGLSGSESDKLLHLHISNTSLTAFHHIKARAAIDIRIVDNPNFNNINLTSLRYLEGTLEVTGNGPLSFINMSSVIYGPSMTIEGVVGMDISMLQTTGDFIMRNNSFSTLEAPSLGLADGSLIVSSNENLSEINMLKFGIAEKDFIIEDNPSLQTIDRLINFNTAKYGDIRMTGNFSSISLQSLFPKSIGGSFFINTTHPGFDCTAFDRTLNTGKDAMTSANYTCFASSSNSTEDSAIHYIKPHHLTNGAKAGIAVGVIVGAVLIAGALWFGLSRMKKRPEAVSLNPVQKTTSGTESTVDH